jgi:TetR/AcrR family transcriptional regulator, tetracycline repressor protein
MVRRRNAGGRDAAPASGAGARRPGRPRTGERHLDRTAILEAGLRIVDRDGIEALTMRRLAAALGVNPMSIYHHVPGGKAAVLSGLIEQVFSQMRVTPPAGRSRWQDQVKDAARAYRRVLRAHPDLALRIVADTGAVAQAVVAAGEPFYAALERTGLPPRSVFDAVNLLVDFIHGFMLGEASNPSATFDLGPDLLERLGALPPGTAPALTRVAGALGAEGLRYEYDSDFETGLDVLVKGVEAVASAHRAGRAADRRPPDRRRGARRATP